MKQIHKRTVHKTQYIIQIQYLSGFTGWKLVQKLTENFNKHHRQVTVSIFSLTFVKLTEALFYYTSIHKEWNFAIKNCRCQGICI